MNITEIKLIPGKLYKISYCSLNNGMEVVAIGIFLKEVYYKHITEINHEFLVGKDTFVFGLKGCKIDLLS